MGKTAHNHPISLHVLRGAAEYCGWKFKKITWQYGNQSKSQACYIAEIETMPKSADTWPLKTMKAQLQHCFMDDITVVSMWSRPDGRWLCKLYVDLTVEATTAEKYDGEL